MATYPGLSPEMSAALTRFLAGQLSPLDPNFKARRHRIHSRIQIPQAGQTTDFQFFNSDPADEFIGNMKAQGLPPETVAVVYSLGLRVETGFTVAGVAAPTGDQGDVDTTDATFELAEGIRKMHENGLVNLKFGDTIILEDQHGVNNFPDGAGTSMDAAGWGTTGTQQGQVANTNNGIAAIENRLAFTPVAILLPQKRVRLTVRYKTAIALAAAEVGVFKASLDCTLITPTNN